MALAAIHLKILLHCYTTPERHHSMDTIPGREACDMLRIQGMIESYDRTFKTTAKGDFYIKHLLEIPFPETTFVIPEAK